MKKEKSKPAKNCDICSRIPERASAHSCYYNEPDTNLPDEVHKLENIVNTHLRKCPLCGTYYFYEWENDNAMYGGCDQYLTRITPEKALEMLEGMKTCGHLEKYYDIIDNEIKSIKSKRKK